MDGRRYIICKNKEGAEIWIGEKGFAPFVLMQADGVYTVDNHVATTANTMMDGSTYHSSIANMRNIVLTIANMSPYPYNRDILNEVFKEGDPGTLFFHEDGGQDKVIDYYVESIESDGTPASVIHTISLLCPDPFFYAPTDTTVMLAEWKGLFEFLHEFVEEGEELGVKSDVRMVEIMNRNLVNRVGMKITITCTGAAVNPFLSIVETNERIQIGSDARPFTLVNGDELVITTETGDKHVWLTHDGRREEVNYHLTEDSTFLQLRRGTNTIGYGATSGDEYMIIKIEYRMKFARA